MEAVVTSKTVAKFYQKNRRCNHPHTRRRENLEFYFSVAFTTQFCISF